MERHSKILNLIGLETYHKKLLNFLNGISWKYNPKVIENDLTFELNKLKESGIYISNKETNKFNDNPSSNNLFSLQVFGNKDKYINQLLLDNVSNHMFIRRYEYETDSWSPWERILSQMNFDSILGLKHDDNLLYLNEKGLKKEGYYYFDIKKDSGIFECIKETRSTINSDEFFKDISHKAIFEILNSKRDTSDSDINKNQLTLFAEGKKEFILSANDKHPQASIVFENGNLILKNHISEKEIKLYNDGSASYPANNLKTPEKDIVGAINRLSDEATKVHSTPIGSDSKITDLNNLREAGNFINISLENYYKNIPKEIVSFEKLKLTGESLSIINSESDYGKSIEEILNGINNEFFSQMLNTIINDKFHKQIENIFLTKFTENGADGLKQMFSEYLFATSTCKFNIKVSVLDDTLVQELIPVDKELPIFIRKYINGSFSEWTAQLTANDKVSKEIFKQKTSFHDVYDIIHRYVENKRNKNDYDFSTNSLHIIGNEYAEVALFNRNKIKHGALKYSDDKVEFTNTQSDTSVILYNDGTAFYPAKNLNTKDKNLVGAVNTINNDIITIQDRISNEVSKINQNVSSNINEINSNITNQIQNVNNQITAMKSGLSIKAEQFYIGNSNKNFGINLNNSDLIGINALVFSDISDGKSEGILFPKSYSVSGSININDYDSFWAQNGVAKFNGYSLWHTGNFNPDNKLNKSGDRITGAIISRQSTSWINGRDDAILTMETDNSSYGSFCRQKGSNYTVTVGALGNSNVGFYTYSNSRTSNDTDGYLRLNVNGNSEASGTFSASKIYNAVWNDYAEFFPRGEETEAGDIISLDINSDTEKYVKAKEGDTCVVGVHSDEFGHLIGGKTPNDGEDYFEKNIKEFIPVGLAGRVNVKFIGKAKKGMKVVPSNIHGVGREYIQGKDDPDSIIGFVVENNFNQEIKRVRIKIK